MGTLRDIRVTNGAVSTHERQSDDYYATDPRAVELLLAEENFSPEIWECACGGGHIANVLRSHGHEVRCTDIADRGCEGAEILDFLATDEKWDGDIITNPPYKYGKEFVQKALDTVTNGHRVAMLLKLTFLESQSRAELFSTHPPRYIYVSRNRLQCAMNGDFERYASGSAIAYAWFIWEKGFKSEPVVRWIN